jgi:hypothetical protein
MQNKPNLLDTQMNITIVLTKYYENKRFCRRGEKQTQTNPTCSELVESISNITLQKRGITSFCLLTKSRL